MRELIINFVQALSDHFSGKTVGAGGDFGSTLTRGPFKIGGEKNKLYFHQWQDIVNPSIHVQIIQEQPVTDGFECCGGTTALTLNVRISVDQKEHSWSIAAALYEELRSWLCSQNYQLGGDCEYLVFVGQNSIVAQHVYEGDIFSIHTKVDLTYLRRFE